MKPPPSNYLSIQSHIFKLNSRLTSTILNNKFMSSESESSSEDDYLPITITPRASRDFEVKIFECSICMDLYRPPLLNCPNEHFYCKKCVIQERAFNQKKDRERCPQCKETIDLNSSNSFFMSYIQKVFFDCSYCNKAFKLSEIRDHEDVCDENPSPHICVYRQYPDIMCGWKGKQDELALHLIGSHNALIYEGYFFRFLWDIPPVYQSRIRPRVLKVEYPASPTNYVYFYLEHIYFPERQKLVYCIKSLDENISLDYEFVLRNRNENSEPWESFVRRAEVKSDLILSKFPDCDNEKIIQFPLHILEQLKYYIEKDEKFYYAFTIEFNLLNNLNL